METRRAAESDHFHAVKFYKDDASLAGIVCHFLLEGMKRGEPAVIIATTDHIPLFLDGLTAGGINVDSALDRGALTVLEADETLERFMRDGIPMSKLFTDTLTPVFTATAAQFPGTTVRAYGEMVDVLWKRDQTAAAIRLEMLWNELARSYRFGLLCGYAMGNFYKGSATDDICGVHTHVMTETGSQVSL